MFVSEPWVVQQPTMRLLHAVLYTLLLQNQLRSAIELVELLIRQENVKTAAALYRQDQETKLSVFTLIQQVLSSLPYISFHFITAHYYCDVYHTNARLCHLINIITVMFTIMMPDSVI